MSEKGMLDDKLRNVERGRENVDLETGEVLPAETV